MFLDRACLLARNIAVRQAGATGGQIWEHFHPDWTPDLEYNRNDTSNSLRPWGIQTGHQTEWSKLLIILERHRPEPWRIECARNLHAQIEKARQHPESNHVVDGEHCCRPLAHVRNVHRRAAAEIGEVAIVAQGRVRQDVLVGNHQTFAEPVTMQRVLEALQTRKPVRRQRRCRGKGDRRVSQSDHVIDRHFRGQRVVHRYHVDAFNRRIGAQRFEEDESDTARNQRAHGIDVLQHRRGQDPAHTIGDEFADECQFALRLALGIAQNNAEVLLMRREVDGNGELAEIRVDDRRNELLSR